jgi:hypothetical protein
MQRGLAADQKPVEAEKAQLVDDSHWEIAQPPEKKTLLNTERQKCVLVIETVGIPSALQMTWIFFCSVEGLT